MDYYNGSEMTKEEIKNLGARLKSATGDLFDGIKNFTLDNNLDVKAQNIIQERYYEVDKSQYRIGVNGKRNYGVITKVDLEKRDAILRQFGERLRATNKPMPNAISMLLLMAARMYANASMSYIGIELAFRQNQDLYPIVLEGYQVALRDAQQMGFILSHLQLPTYGVAKGLVGKLFKNKASEN